MRRRLLVLGAAGMLGEPTFRAAASAREECGRLKFEVHVTVRPGTGSSALSAPKRCHELDLAELGSVHELLHRIRPELVINCAGVVKQRPTGELETILVNAALPHRIARSIESWGGRLIQVSTDCVFSGDRGGYTEEDPAEPTDLYGRTKTLGEVAAPHLTVRTSFIGRERGTQRGLLEWLLGQDRGARLEGYRGAQWSGLTSERLASVLLELAEHPQATGVVHVAGEVIDKYRLLCTLARLFQRSDLEIVPVDEPVIDRSLRAQRLETLGIRVPPLSVMLEELASGAKPGRGHTDGSR